MDSESRRRSANSPGRGEHLGVDGHPDQHQQQGRQQPPGPPGPELPQPDGQPLGPLPDQQRGDQEPGEHEEHVDAEEPAADQGRPAVEEHHAEHGDGPQAVEAGDEAEADRPAAARSAGTAGDSRVGRGMSRTHRVRCLRSHRRRPATSRTPPFSQIRAAVHGRDAPPTGALRPPIRTSEQIGRPTWPGPDHTVGLYPAGRLMVFFSRNSSRPSSPNSRPTPDAL